MTTCTTPTCFTCRKRIAGRAPIRRYNTTSARTLAVYLASQDNPETALCPTLKPPKSPPTALNSLIFSPKYPAPPSLGVKRTLTLGGQTGHARSSQPKNPSDPSVAPAHDDGGEGSHSPTSGPGPGPGPDRTEPKPPPSLQLDGREEDDDADTDADLEPKFTIVERPASKDYRSFAANMFGTVAFKMLEWLTPAAVARMSEKARELQGKPPSNGKANATSPRLKPEAAAGAEEDERPLSPHSKPAAAVLGASADQPHPPPPADAVNGPRPTTASDASPEEPPPAAEAQAQAQAGESHPDAENGATDGEPPDAAVDKDLSHRPPVAPPPAPPPPPPSSRSNQARRNSNARVRTPGSAKAKRRLSIDTFPPPDTKADDLLPGLRSPRLSALQTDKNARTLKTSASTIPRPISQLSNAGYFDGVSLEKMPPPKTSEIRPRTGRGQSEPLPTSDGESSGPSPSSASSPSSSSTARRGSEQQQQQQHTPSSGRSTPAFDPDLESTYDAILPQALGRLTAEMVDFVCDVLQDDGTAEPHMLEPATVSAFHVRNGQGQPKPLKRKPAARPRQPASSSLSPNLKLKLEWRLFVEQSLFYVLSDPHAVVRSFTKKGQLWDSQTLWYCMLRMTRAAPSLVFHSLWMAADVLFAPPKSLQARGSPTARLFPKPAAPQPPVQPRGRLAHVHLPARPGGRRPRGRRRPRAVRHVAHPLARP